MLDLLKTRHLNRGHALGRGEEDMPDDLAGMSVFWANGSRAEMESTPFSLTRDQSILYVAEEGLMSDGDKYRLEDGKRK